MALAIDHPWAPFLDREEWVACDLTIFDIVIILPDYLGKRKKYLVRIL